MLGIPTPFVPLPPGLLVEGRFRIGRPLADPPCNSYAAQDRQSGDDVVLKLLAAMPHPVEVERVREAVAPLASLDAAFLPRVVHLATFRHADRHCVALVQEHIEGETLAQRIEKRGVMSPEQLKPVARRLLEIMRRLYRIQPPLLHGDVNPHNVLLRPDGGVVLVDWASPKAAARDWGADRFGPEGWAQACLRPFAAPEVPIGSPNPRSDLFGVGACLLWALTQRTPDQVRDLHPQRVMALALERLHVSKAWIALLVPLLEPTLERRLRSPQHALEILVDPAAAFEGGPRRKKLRGESVDWHLEPRGDVGERWSALGVALAVLACVPLLAASMGVVVPVLFGMKLWAVVLRVLLGLALVTGGGLAVRSGWRSAARFGRMRLQGLGRCLRVIVGQDRVEIPWLHIGSVRKLGPVLRVRGAWRQRPGAPLRRRTLWLPPVYEVGLDTVAARLGAHRAHAASLVPAGHASVEGVSRWRPGRGSGLSLGLLLVVVVLLSGRWGAHEPDPDGSGGKVNTPAPSDQDQVAAAAGAGTSLEERAETLAEWASVRPATTPEEARKMALEGLAPLLAQDGFAASAAGQSFQQAVAEASGRPLPEPSSPVSAPTSSGPEPASSGSGSAPDFIPDLAQALRPLEVEADVPAAKTEAPEPSLPLYEGPLPEAFPCPEGMQRRLLADPRLMDPACQDEHGTMVRVAAAGSQASLLLDWTEVTVRDYAGCVVDGACTAPSGAQGCHAGSSTRGQHPVNCVDREQAKAYCAWTGRRLCTAREHTRAARGSEGALYPWGDAPPSCDRLIMDGRGTEGVSDAAGCGRGSSWPVGSRPAGVSPVGALDLSGNMAEWVLGERDGAMGGSYLDRAPEELQAESLRPVPGDLPLPDVGFRCCRDGVD